MICITVTIAPLVKCKRRSTSSARITDTLTVCWNISLNLADQFVCSIVTLLILVFGEGRQSYQRVSRRKIQQAAKICCLCVPHFRWRRFISISISTLNSRSKVNSRSHAYNVFKLIRGITMERGNAKRNVSVWVSQNSARPSPNFFRVNFIFINLSKYKISKAIKRLRSLNFFLVSSPQRFRVNRWMQKSLPQELRCPYFGEAISLQFPSKAIFGSERFFRTAFFAD